MVEKSLLPLPRTRNAHTHARHRQETLWQIALPCGLAVMVIIGLMVVVASPAGAEARSPLADVSLIFVIIPTAFWGLVLLALIIGLCYGLFVALRELPFLFKQAQEFMWLTAHEAKRYTAYVGNAIVSIRSWVAALEKLTTDIRSIFTFGRRV